DETVRRLVADGARIRAGDPDRPALVATDRHIALSGGHEGRAPARGAAGGALRIVRVQHRPGVGGVAAPGEAEVLADGLADDLAAGGEDPGDDRRLDVAHVPCEDGGAVHRRTPRHAPVALAW